MKETERPQKLELKQKLEDLNGIEPSRPLQFSIVAALMAVIGWQITSFLSSHFAIEFVDSEIYPMQRIAIVARNIVVGIMTLGKRFCVYILLKCLACVTYLCNIEGTTFSGVIAIGLVFLSVRVALGVSKGELDPNKPVEDTAPPSYKDGAIRTTGDMLKQIFNEKK